jgi:hypothetical protein
LLNIETVYTNLFELPAKKRIDFLDDYVYHYEEIKIGLPCIEGSCEAFNYALELTINTIEPFKFDSLKSKMANIGDAANYFRKISCKKCVSTWQLSNKSYCFQFEFKYLPAFLISKLKGKTASDGVIKRKDIKDFIDTMAEYLFDCTNISKDIDIDIGEYPESFNYLWELHEDVKQQLFVLGKN